MSFIINPSRFAVAGGYDEYTKLMLHFDGANGATTTVDSSPSAHTMTAAFGGQLTTAQSKFGGSCSSHAVNAARWVTEASADWNLNAGDFTVDCWARVPTVQNTKATYYLLAVSNPAESAYHGDIRYTPSSGGTAAGFVDILDASGSLQASFTGAVFSANTWYHIAVVRNGNVWKCYVNGTQYGSTVTKSISFGTLTTDKLIIGTSAMTTDYPLFLDEFRVSKGVARWTANFTPPTAAYG